MNGFRPPGRLKLILMWLGDQLYVLLLSLGWQPREEDREPGKR